MRKQSVATAMAAAMACVAGDYASAQQAASAQQTAPAGAQTPAGGPAETTTGLQEVIVTAERRTESSQRVAVALSTVTGDTIANANVLRPGIRGGVPF